MGQCEVVDTLFRLRRSLLEFCYVPLQLEELKAIPDKMEKDLVEYKKKLEKLEKEKVAEEEKLKVVMEGLKTETQVAKSSSIVSKL